MPIRPSSLAMFAAGAAAGAVAAVTYPKWKDKVAPLASAALAGAADAVRHAGEVTQAAAESASPSPDAPTVFRPDADPSAAASAA